MTAVPIPQGESERLLALRRYDVPGGIPQEAFGRILRLVTDILGLPMASINFIDEVQHFAKASLGIGLIDLPRNESFCAWAILTSEGLAVPDLRTDERFQDSPLVSSAGGLRAYAGAPLTTPQGQRIGTLCVADDQVHELSARERRILASLAQLVMDELELRLRERELEKAARYAQVLAGVSGLGEEELSPEQMAVHVAELLNQATDLAWVGLIELRGGQLHQLSQWNPGRLDPELEARLRQAASPETGVIGESLRRRASVFVDDYAEYQDTSEHLKDTDVGGVACLYLNGGAQSGSGSTGGNQGVPQLLLAVQQQRAAWTAAEKTLFQAAGRSLKIALERQQHVQDMEQAAYTDALTGLRNRRGFVDDLQTLARQDQAYSVVMIDLDGMKTVNDTQGHAEGDLLLQTFARHLIRGLYAADLAYRLGGDEFALVLRDPPTSAEVLQRIVRERLKRAVAWTRAQGFSTIDASLGWASVPGDAQSGQAALKLADQRMYQHKAGRVHRREEEESGGPDQVPGGAED